jgi:hypothetical protein
VAYTFRFISTERQTWKFSFSGLLFSADMVHISFCREAMLASAPDRDGPFLKVPKIMKENQE